jgi:hypothetical protein
MKSVKFKKPKCLYGGRAGTRTPDLLRVKYEGWLFRLARS